MGGRAGERVPVAVVIVSSEELIEGRGYIGHWRIWEVLAYPK